MLMILILAANACGVTWDPVGVLPGGIRSKLEGAQVVSPCRVASLPAAVQEFLMQQLGHEKLGMADPGQQWNSSCVRPMEGLPSRQLIAVAKAGRNWVVHYREGGEAVVEMAVVLEDDGHTIRQVWQGWCMGDAGGHKCSDPDRLDGMQAREKVLRAIDAAIAEAETLLKRYPERPYYSALGDSLRKMRKDVDGGWPVDDETADWMMEFSDYLGKALDYPDPGDEEYELWSLTTDIEDATAEGLGREIPEEE